MSDDPAKCVSRHLGIGSPCHYRKVGSNYGIGAVGEFLAWQCSDDCKRRQADARKPVPVYESELAGWSPP